MSTGFFDAETRATMAAGLNRALAGEKPGTPQHARAMVVTVCDLVSDVLAKRNSPSRVFLEYDEVEQIIGWGVFDGRITTDVFSLSASSNVIRLNTKPFYVGDEYGVAVWFESVLSATERNVRVTR